MNTGWSGGKYGVGKRMSLKTSRGLIDAIHSGELDKAEYTTMPGFNLHVPKNVKGIDPNILLPINTWDDKEGYKTQARKLAEQFIKNMENYKDGVPKEVIERGGPNTNF